MNKIIRRIFMVLPAVLIQLLWLGVLFKWLAPWAVLINFALSILSFLFVLYLIMNREEGTYKILWLLVIMAFPIPGTALYLFFGNKRTTRPLQRKLAAAKPLPALPDGSAPLYERLASENKRLAQTFQSMQAMTGFPIRPNRQAVFYPLGDKLFPAMLEALQTAERFIFVEYFIIENGLMWDSMVKIMEQKAAQGVDVRILYDDLGSISTYSKENAKKLEEKGFRCAAFNPLVFVKGTLNYRDHRKMLIIDGKTAFSGGVNLADEYINHVTKYGHWKDIGFRLDGEAVQNYTWMFAEFWNAFTGDAIPDGLLTPPPADSPEYAWFFTPYLMPGDALQDAFARAARRGVDVRIIMPGIPDKKLVFRMSQSFYPVLLEAGVRIYEYAPGFVHAKGCVIDGTVGTVGTVNLDYRSLFLHFENNSLFYRASLLESLKADFLATQEQCRERTLENVGLSFRHWLLDGILRIFAPLC